jgi:hypothetical protein
MKQATKSNPEQDTAGFIYFTSQPDAVNLFFQDEPPHLQAPYLQDGAADLVNHPPIMCNVSSNLPPWSLSIGGIEYMLGPEEHGAQQSQAPYVEGVGYSNCYTVPNQVPFRFKYHKRHAYMPQFPTTIPFWTPPTDRDRNVLSCPAEPGMSWTGLSSPICDGMYALISLQLSRLINL